MASSFSSAATIKSTILSLRSAKRAMLETSAYALQEGDALLSELNRMLKGSDEAVRWPGHIKQEINLAIGQVELWLEELHDRRVESTRLYERCLRQLELLETSSPRGKTDSPQRQLGQISEELSAKEAEVSGLSDLGSSLSSCDRLMREVVAKQAEVQEIADR